MALMNRPYVSFLLLWVVYVSSSCPASARSYSSYSVYTSALRSTHQQSLRSSPAQFTASQLRGSRRRLSPFTTFATLTAAQTSPPLLFADTNVEKERPLSYQDLSPLGRLVAGTVEVVVVTVLEYMSGMVGGYLLGSVTDVPSLLFRPVDGVKAAGGWNQVSSRFLRLHTKSLRWGSSWAEISATCGGMNVAIRALRGGTDDEWNTVFGSMAAGAFFRRKEGLQAMLSGAILYGGLVYVLGGGLGKREQLHFKELPVEF